MPQKLLRFGFIIMFGFINAAIFMMLWLWHVTPLGPPRIALGRALGLMFTIEFVTFKYNTTHESDSSAPLFAWVLTRAAFSGTALLFGWIATLL